MARMAFKGLMSLALMGALAYATPAMAIIVDDPNPNADQQFSLDAMLKAQQQLTNMQQLGQLSQLNGFDPSKMTMENLAKTLAVSMLNSAMSGNFDMQSVLMDTGKMMLIGSIGGIQQPNIGGVGGVNTGFNGLSGLTGGTSGLNGLNGLSGLTGGSDVLGTVISKVIGGIQGSGSSGGNNFGGFDVASLSGSNIRTDANGNPVEFVQNPDTGVFEEVVK